MIKKVDHMGVAVKSIEAALPFFSGTLGLSVNRVTDVSGRGVRVAFLPAGETAIELVEATREGSAVSEFLKKNGEGLYHVCLEVEDMDAAVADLRDKGIRLIGDAPRQGPMGRIIFAEAADCHGVSIELLEKSK